MTPQPEESPDEILARMIAQDEMLLVHISQSVELPGPEGISAREDYREVQVRLSERQAHRALRKIPKLITHHPYCHESHEVEMAYSSLRQSDDAIRGMRG